MTLRDIRQIINPFPQHYYNEFNENIDNILENLIVHNNVIMNSYILNDIIYNNRNGFNKDKFISSVGLFSDDDFVLNGAVILAENINHMIFSVCGNNFLPSNDPILIIEYRLQSSILFFWRSL